LVQLRKQALRTVMKTDQGLGLLTPENLQRLERGEGTVVTRGNPKYLGEATEVDHRIPIRGPNGRAIYENEVANLQVLPRSVNRQKWAHVDEISNAHEAKLDRAYWADRYAVASGAATAGIGVLVLYTSGSALLADLEGQHDDLTSKLRMGENASLFVGGGAMTVAGIGTLAKLESVAEWGGKISIYTFILAESIAVVQDVYQWEHLSEGQKYVAWIRHGSNTLLIFVMIPQNPLSKNPWVAIPVLVLAGAGHGVAYLVDKYYAGLEELQRQQIRAFIYKFYGVSE